jgi:hypothetical protein
MCVVPDMVKKKGAQNQCLFDVKRLKVPTADLSDPFVREHFLSEGRLLGRAGVLLIQSPTGGGLALGDILEIEDRFAEAFRYFQTHLRTTLLEANPDNETRSLSLVLQKVDEGILELDAKFQGAQRRCRGPERHPMAAGALAIAFYGEGRDAGRFLEGAFSDASLSSRVSLLTDPRQIPEEVRQSPFFLPWLISRQQEAPERRPPLL